MRKSLHWLKAEQRIQYKIISITHNLLHITEPKYLHRLINIKLPSGSRSSDHLCLSITPVTTRLKFADQSFRNSSPRLWNSLPINLRSFAPDTHHSTTVMSSTPSHPCRALSLFHNKFLSCLKTHLFTLFLPSIIYLLSRFSLLLSRPASFNQYSSRTNANKHIRIHHHFRVLVSLGLYKALLYFLFTLRYLYLLVVGLKMPGRYTRIQGSVWT